MDWPNTFCLSFYFCIFSTDAETFEPEEPIKKAVVMDKWEGEDEEEDVKVLLGDKWYFIVIMRRTVVAVSS